MPRRPEPALRGGDAYRADIDGLRAVAVIAVVGYHSTSHLPGGYVGVDVFFVISGYLITGILWRGLATGSFRFLQFYARRARRIFPALALVLLATMAMGWLILLPDEFDRLAHHVVAAAGFASNFQLWSEAGYFDVSATAKPLLHLWSLGVEEQFYLLWPVTLTVVWKVSRSRPIFPQARPQVRAQADLKAFAATVIVASASLVFSVIVLRRDPVAAFYSPLTRFWEIQAGAILAIFGEELRDSARLWMPTGLEKHKRAVTDALSIAGIALVLISVALFDTGTQFPGAHALLPTLGAALIIATGPSSIVSRSILSNRALVYLGLISYPLYLWHWPLLSFGALVAPLQKGAARLLILAADGAALIAAAASYELVELPLRKLRLGVVAARASATLGGTVLLAVIVVGSKGFPERVGFHSDPFTWPADFSQSAGCLARYQIPRSVATRAFCASSNVDAPADIVVLGDSHANALYPGVQQAHRQEQVLSIGGAGCPFIRMVREWRIDEPAQKEACPYLIDAGYRSLAGGPKTVVVSAAFALYLSRTGFGPVQSARYNPRTLYFDSPEFPNQSGQEFLATTLERDLRYLQGEGHKILFVMQVPELDFPISQCVVRPYALYLRMRQFDCTIARSKVEARQSESRAIVYGVIARLNSPAITVLDPMGVLCDSLRCHAVIGGELLYRDAIHLSIAGSKYVWSRLESSPSRLASSATIR